MKERFKSTVALARAGVAALAFASASLSAQPFVPAEVGATVNGFQDDFNGTALGANWTVAGQNVFSVNGGLLHVSTASGDPNHLLYTLPGYNRTIQEVLARIRVTSFGAGSYSRCGLSVAVEVGTSQGINYTFRDYNGEGQTGRHTALLDDFREWGPGQGFVWQNNVWYWMRLRQEPNAASQGGVNDVFAKIWLGDGSVPEPAGWQLVWNYNASRSTRSGYAGVMAGSTGGSAQDFAVLDLDYILIKASGLPAVVVALGAFTPVPAAITNQPQNQTVMELSPASFSVGARGNPAPTFQWFKNNVPIAGATNATYSFARAPASDHGALFQVVAANVISNVTYSATSSVATLTVIADTNPPVLLGARSLGLELVQASFSERVTAVSATNLPLYLLTGAGGTVSILSADLDASQTNVLLTVSTLIEDADYTLTVNGVTDQSAAANAIMGGTAQFTARRVALFITEFQANNATGLADADGDHSDWIELQNQSPFAVDIGGWRLTDDPANLGQWIFPSTALQPGQFLVVFASGKDRRAPGAELHTKFRLDADGEYLALVRPDGVVAQQFTFGHQRQDISFGAVGNTNLFMVTPTPGMMNGPGVLGFVADTKFSTNRGFFSNAFSLTITSATPAAEIWFTTDGSVPERNGPTATRHAGPITIANTTTVRARGVLSGYAPTDVDTHTFIFTATAARQPGNPVGFPTTWQGYAADYAIDQQIVNGAAPGYDITNALLSLPTISLVAPVGDWFSAATGIYANSDQQGDNWEREASVELIFPDGSPGFQYEAGVRVHGYTSRYHSTTLKHSLRVSFRDRYGPAKLRFPLFPDAGVNDFDALTLRACSTDSYPVVDASPRWEARRASYLRDQWMRDTMRDFGQPTSHGRYVHLWINGLYWGLYNAVEALDADFAAEHLGGGKSEYDVIKDYFFIDDGNRLAWDEAAALASQGFATEAAYQRIQGNNPDGSRNTNYPIYLNLSNYVDYVMVHITSGAYDWPLNNWWSCRRRGPESEGFRFCVWDQEEGIYSLARTHNVFCQPFAEASETLFCAGAQGQYHAAYFYDILRRTSPSFRQLFMDRAWFAHTGNGPLSPGASAARWLARQNEIDRAIVAETARWGDARRTPSFTRAGNWLPEMQFVAGYWAPNLLNAIQRYRSVGLWPALGPPVLSQGGGYFTNAFALAITHTNSTGVIWFTTDGSDPRTPSGSPSARAQSYSMPISVNVSTRVRARVTDGSNWSPPADATFLPYQALTNLVVSEIYYNPSGAAGVDGEAFEFLELQNRGAFTLDLSGLRFTAGINFAFTNGTALAPGAYFVLARDATNFAARFPGALLHGFYTGKLDNDGETLTAQNRINDTIFSFAYNDAPPWPVSADGPGASLHRTDFSGSTGDATRWTAGLPTPGLAPVEFKVENISIRQAGEVALTFVALSNRTYSVQQSPSLLPGLWSKLTDVPLRPTNRLESIIAPNAAQTRFYRLVTPDQP